MRRLHVEYLAQVTMAPSRSNVRVSRRNKYFVRFPMLRRVYFRLRRLEVLILRRHLVLIIPFPTDCGVARQRGITNFTRHD